MELPGRTLPPSAMIGSTIVTGRSSAVRRLLAQIAIVAVLTSCARSPQVEPPSDMSTAQLVSTEISPAISPATTTSAPQILNPGDDQLAELTVATGPGTTVLGISRNGAGAGAFGESNPTEIAQMASTQQLSNPARLVVDIPAQISTRAVSRSFPTESDVASQVRVSSYKGKTRIVFDLNSPGTAVPTASVGATEEGLTIALNSGASPATSVAMGEPNSESSQVAASSSTAASINSDMPRLAAMRLEKVGPQANQLVLEMDSAGVFSMKRTAPSEFVLRLEGASLADAANQVLIAPSLEGKIRSVRPTIDGSDVVLRIFSSPETSLRAEARNGNVIVFATSIGAEVLDGARAQLAPEKSESDSESKGDTAKGPESATADADAEAELGALLEDQQYTGRLISLDLQDTDIDNALRIIAEVSNLNIVTTEDVQGKITLRLVDVPWDQALDVILKINSLGKVQEGNVVRIAPLDKIRAEREALKQAKQAEEQLEELKVRYLRISYARAADLKPLTETVLTERGSVAYDERSNQLIVKDTKAGVSRVIELVKKLDLRTPQVLLETQIVESKRGFQRQLGSRFGFKFIQSPSTGNGTGKNFPNSVIGNGTGNNLGELTPTSPGVLNLLFGSADGTRNLDITLAAAENEGLAKVISRPSVATTNNKQASIKSVTKLRVKTPSGGTQVAVGQGGQTAGSPVATETIEAGITLDVTPQASPDYYVLLDINAKSSSFDTTTSVDGIPSEVERSATSTILVSSGQTFVMGGIYKITENHTLNGIPFMKDIPVFGHMFRFSDVNDTDEELLFFITPRIVEGSFDDAAMKASL